MLVNKSIVEKWYQRDSLVYKNFSYLFSNPLWDKTVPNGFSVCPYFWLSMFSLFIFRPFFVAPIKYFALPILRLIGKPAFVVDEFLFKFSKSILGFGGGYFKGSGLFSGTLLLAVAAAALTLLVILGVKTTALYLALSTTTLGLFTFYSAASFVSLFGVIAAHKKITKTECKTLYYLVVWAVLFVIASFVVVPTETTTMLATVATTIGHGIATGASNVYHFVVWAVCGLASIAWIGLKIAFSWKPIAALLLPWWGFIVILTVIGWAMDKFYTYYDAKHVDYVRKTNHQELFAIYRSAWIETFIHILMTHPRWKKNEVLADHITDPCIYNASLQFRQTLLRQAFETYWKKELDTLQQNYPTLPKDALDFLKKEEDYSTDARFSVIGNHLIDQKITFPTMSVEDFIKVLVDKINNDQGVKNLALHYRELEKQSIAKAAAKKTSWSHTTCLKVTNAIATFVKTSARQTGRGIKTAAVQTATLTAYLWMLAKAKKQGACPYFKFTDKTSGVDIQN